MRRGSGDGSLIKCILIFLLLVFAAPHLPTNWGENQQNATTVNNPITENTMTWTILAHDGYYAEVNCWQLRLHREWDDGEETAQYCAKDKADYDTHKDGASYTTTKDWMDNIIEHANPDNATHAA